MKSQPQKKQEVLMLLKKNESLTFEDIMSHFTISEPALRKHIHQLERQHLIEKKAHKQKIGRPYYTYQLTKQGHQLFPQNDRLSLELLHDLENLYGRKAVNELFQERMEREKSTYEEICTSDAVEDRLEEVARLQSENGYMAEVRKYENGEIEMINYNCPIYKLARTYGQLCSNEKTMYEHLFPDRSVRMDSNIVAGDHTCRWIIAPKETE